jgi:hypothetical protein
MPDVRLYNDELLDQTRQVSRPRLDFGRVGLGHPLVVIGPVRCGESRGLDSNIEVNTRQADGDGKEGGGKEESGLEDFVALFSVGPSRPLLVTSHVEQKVLSTSSRVGTDKVERHKSQVCLI